MPIIASSSISPNAKLYNIIQNNIVKENKTFNKRTFVVSVREETNDLHTSFNKVKIIDEARTDI